MNASASAKMFREEWNQTIVSVTFGEAEDSSFVGDISSKVISWNQFGNNASLVVDALKREACK